MPRESNIEARLRTSVHEAGGWAIKLLGFPGLPDRLVLMPMGRVWFVEVKTAGGRLSKAQIFVHAKLEKLGFPVTVLWSYAEIDTFMEQITCRTC